jgi:hypothetical protein
LEVEPDDDEPFVVYCPGCAEREFGRDVAQVN